MFFNSKLRKMEKIMATLEDQVAQILAAVQNPPVPPAPTVDLTPVLNAVSGLNTAVAALQTTANNILAQFSVTPPAPPSA